MVLYIAIMFVVRSLIKQPGQTGNKEVIKTFKFKRGGCVKSLLLCAYNLSICTLVDFMNGTLFKVANGRFYYVELVGKRIPNRCCL